MESDGVRLFPQWLQAISTQAQRCAMKIASGHALAVLVTSLAVSFTLASQPAVAQNVATAAPVRRITAAVNDGETVRMKGGVHPLARPEFDLGPTGQNLPLDRVVMVLQGTAEQDQALEKLLVDLQDPSSPDFHRWLTPEEFGRRFGAAEEDVAAVTQWLTTHGFRVGGVAKNRRLIEFSGTAGQVASAFHTEIHRFAVNGAEHYANAAVPSVPAALSPVVRGLLSLHNFPRRSTSRIQPASDISLGGDLRDPGYTATDGSHYITPYDFATIYNVLPLWNSGVTGAGQSIAVIGRTIYNSSDITFFRCNTGLPGDSTSVIVNGASPGYLSKDEIAEAELDVEWAGAVARDAQVIFVASASTNATDGIDLSSSYAIDNDLAPIITVSFLDCETDAGTTSFYGPLWKQAAAQGISVLVGTGDSGSAGCDYPPDAGPASNGFGVNGLGSTPDNVAVGGTQFNENGQDSAYWKSINDPNTRASAVGYIPEVVWNESFVRTLWATGGGVSAIFATPAWQTGAGVPTSDPFDAGAHHRYVPDVSLSAALHDGYFTCLVGACSAGFSYAGGTSVSTPAFASIMALVLQHTGSRQGNPNFHLYPLSAIPGVYHDITSGSNAVRCVVGSSDCDATTQKMKGYSAGPGYDLATGWGSVDVNALVTNWNNVRFHSTNTTGTVAPDTVQHGSSVNLTATVTSSSGTPTGAVEACVVSGGKTAVLGVGDLASGGAAFSSNKAPGGTSTLFFRYGGDGTYGSSTSSGTTLTVTPEPVTITVTPSSPTLQLGQSYSLTATVAGSSGLGTPSGKVTLSQGSTAVGSENLDGTGKASFTSLWYFPHAPGTYTFTSSYSGDASFQANSASFNLTFTKAQASATLSCAAHQVVAGTDFSCSVFVLSSFGGPKPTGTIQFYDGGTALGAPVAINASGSASLSLSGLAASSHVITMSYSGDSYYLPADYPGSTITFVAATVTISFSAGGSYLPGSMFSLYPSVLANAYGPPLTGTITLLDGGNAVASAMAPPGTSSFFAHSFEVNTSSSPLSLGSHSFTVTYSGDPVWQDKTSGVSTTLISNPDFAIYALNPITITRGSSANLYFYVSSISGLSGTVTLGCTGAPAETYCSLNPTSATIGAGSLLTITTAAPYGAPSAKTTAWLRYLSMLPFGIIFGGVVVGRRRKASMLTLLMLIALLPMVSCGGGGGGSSSSSGGGGTTLHGGTPTGVYTLTITGTYSSGGNTITHSYPLQLTVQ